MCFRPLKSSSVKKILSFEILSSTEWSKFKKKGFEPNYFIDISKQIKQKISSMKHYKMELRKYPPANQLRLSKLWLDLGGLVVA